MLDVLDEGRNGSILTVYGVFFMGEKSKLMCQTSFFSSARCAIVLARHRLRKMQRIACWEKNKQACH